MSVILNHPSTLAYKETWQRTGGVGIRFELYASERGARQTRPHQNRHLAVSGRPRGVGARQSLQMGRSASGG